MLGASLVFNVSIKSRFDTLTFPHHLRTKSSCIAFDKRAIFLPTAAAAAALTLFLCAPKSAQHKELILMPERTVHIIPCAARRGEALVYYTHNFSITNCFSLFRRHSRINNNNNNNFPTHNAERGERSKLD